MKPGTSLSKDKSTLTITIIGEFKSSYLQSFRKAYMGQDTVALKHYIVDLTDCTYVHSSGLGMLLVLKEFAATHEATVKIKTRYDSVKELFDLANFQELFDISRAT